jgi:predicted nucleic acid-binding protein
MAETVILDTNVLKHISQGSQPIADALNRRLKAGDQVWIARAAYNELIDGAATKQMAGQYREMLKDLNIKVAESGPMADRINFMADNIQREPAPNTPGQIKEYGSKAAATRPGDAFIAAQAKALNAKLWTIDGKFVARAKAMNIATVPECSLPGAGGLEDPDAGRRRLGLNPKPIGSNGQVLPLSGGGGGGGGGSDDGTHSVVGVADNTVPEFVPPSAKGQATIAGIQLAFEGVNFVLNLINDHIQKKKVNEALDRVKGTIAALRTGNPRLGVLLIFFYLQIEAGDSIIKPGATFSSLTWGKGVTSDEARRDAFSEPTISTAPGPNQRKFSQEIWIPPLERTSVTTAKCPFKPIALGRLVLNRNRAKFQLVSFSFLGGFDDVFEKTVDLPEDTNADFAILKSPQEVHWYNLSGKQSMSIPLIDAKTPNGSSLSVVDLDPWTPFHAKAAMVFPVDELAETIFDMVSPTDGYQALPNYVNLGMIRWIRPENIDLVRFL